MKRLLIRYEYHYHQISSLSKKHHHHKQPSSIAIILKWKPWAGTWWPDLRRAWHCRPAGWSSCSGSSRTCTPEVWMVGEVLWTWTEVLSHLYKKIQCQPVARAVHRSSWRSSCCRQRTRSCSWIKCIKGTFWKRAGLFFQILKSRPVVSTGASPCVELVTWETSDKTWLPGLEVSHLRC